MNRQLVGLRFVLRLSLIFALGCSPKRNSQDAGQGVNPGTPGPAAQGSPSSNGGGNNIPPQPPGAIPAVPGQVDILIVNALGTVENSVSAKTKEQVQALVSALYAKAANGSGKYRIGMISSKTGSLAAISFPASADPALARTVDFKLKAIDTFLVAALIGCDKASTSFPDPHIATSSPKLCGLDLLSLNGNTREKLLHSWIWALEPMRETLKSHFRTGSKRIYIIVTPENPEFLDLDSMRKMVSAAGGSGELVIHAFASGQNGPKGECGSDVAAAPAALAAANASNGKVGDYCSADWSSTIQGILGSIP